MTALKFGLLISTIASLGFAQEGRFTSTGSMTVNRVLHTATRLQDGRVLITGGMTSGGPRNVPLASAEVFDPATGKFQAVGNMAKTRFRHTATLLNDGRVLITGADGPAMELFDPATGAFSPAPAQGYLAWGPNSTTRPDGTVLITGNNADVYDPATGTFRWLGPLDPGIPAVLPDGRTAVVTSSGVSLFDTTGNTAKLTDRQTYANTRSYPEATVLADGKLLVTGGSGPSYFDPTYTDAWIYDARMKRVIPAKDMLSDRSDHTTTLLGDGRVLVADGYSENAGGIRLGASEIYDPERQTFTSARYDVWERSGHTATLLLDGRVLLAGGGVNATASLYIPSPRTVSAASLTEALAPGSLASFFGPQLTTTTETADPHALPTTLGGIHVSVRDQAGSERLARILYASPSQINFELPEETVPGGLTIRVLRAGSDVAMSGGWVNPIAPSLFTFSNNTLAATMSDGYLTFYGTGFRRAALASVQVEIGGITIPAEYVGPEGSGIPGLDQVNLRIPPSLHGTVEVTLIVDGSRSNTTIQELP